MIAALMVFCSMLSPPPLPDLIPGGWKSFELEMRFEMGDGVRGLHLCYRITEGDSLVTIAAQQLGDAERSREIAASNPGLDPEHLKPGDLLWLPPRNAMRPGELPRFVYVDAQYPHLSYPRPLVANGPSGRRPSGRLTLFLVPPTAVTDFEASRGKVRDAQAVDRMVEQGRIARLECTAPPAYVRDDDPLARRIDTYRFERDPKTGVLSIALTSSDAFDADGERLDGQGAAAGRDGERRKRALVFVLLSLGGAVGLFLARRRRVAPCPRFA